MARGNLARVELAERVTVIHGQIADALRELPAPVDFVFLDADRPNYLAYLDPDPEAAPSGGLLVTDNVVSHALEVEEFLARLRGTAGVDSVMLPVGNGVELTYRRGGPPRRVG